MFTTAALAEICIDVLSRYHFDALSTALHLMVEMGMRERRYGFSYSREWGGGLKGEHLNSIEETRPIQVSVKQLRCIRCQSMSN
jgi:hypothetical protein